MAEWRKGTVDDDDLGDHKVIVDVICNPFGRRTIVSYLADGICESCKRMVAKGAEVEVSPKPLNSDSGVHGLRHYSC